MSAFSFPSGLPDCCAASPDLYKTIAEIEGVARLVEMTFPPGAKDVPHEHPVHSMYFLTDVKLKISGPPTPTKLGDEGGVAELPAGAAPIFPAMAHQVENVGDLIYVEEGDGVTIYPGGDESAPMVVPLAPGAGIPAPMSAPPFAKHIILNSGTKPLKMIFFEAKK